MASLQSILDKLSKNKKTWVTMYCQDGEIVIKVEETYTFKERVKVSLDLTKPMSEQQDLIEKLKEYYG